MRKIQINIIKFYISPLSPELQFDIFALSKNKQSDTGTDKNANQCCGGTEGGKSDYTITSEITEP